MAIQASVPDSVASAWGIRGQRRKGPRPALSRQRIVEAAVRIADAEGLDAVSMGRVAAAAGTAPMSLYRHIQGKDQLIDQMVDAAWGPPPGQPGPGEGWRDGLSRWAWTMRARAHAHPWTVRVPVKSLPVMPTEVAWFETALACMAGTGLSEARKASVVLLLSGYVRNIAGLEQDIMVAVRVSGLNADEWMASYAAILREVADREQFPALAAFIDAGVFDTADEPDDEFVFGLDRILDGVEALIGRGGP